MKPGNLLLAFLAIVIACAMASHHGASSATSTRHTAPAAAPSSKPSTASTGLFDKVPACTNDLESEFDKAPRLPGDGTQYIPVPASCHSLSHAQVQQIADQISANDKESQRFAGNLGKNIQKVFSSSNGYQAG